MFFMLAIGLWLYVRIPDGKFGEWSIFMFRAPKG
jgi:hypothetical protein